MYLKKNILIFLINLNKNNKLYLNIKNKTRDIDGQIK